MRLRTFSSAEIKELADSYKSYQQFAAAVPVAPETVSRWMHRGSEELRLLKIHQARLTQLWYQRKGESSD